MEKFLWIAYYACQIAMIVVPVIACISTFLNRNKKEYTECSYFITTKKNSYGIVDSKR